MKIREITQVKMLAVCLAIATTIYPVFELTRCIVRDNIMSRYWGFCRPDFYAELALIWVLYIFFLLAVCFLVDLAFRIGRKQGGK